MIWWNRGRRIPAYHLKLSGFALGYSALDSKTTVPHCLVICDISGCSGNAGNNRVDLVLVSQLECPPETQVS